MGCSRNVVRCARAGRVRAGVSNARSCSCCVQTARAFAVIVVRFGHTVFPFPGFDLYQKCPFNNGGVTPGLVEDLDDEPQSSILTVCLHPTTRGQKRHYLCMYPMEVSHLIPHLLFIFVLLMFSSRSHPQSATIDLLVLISWCLWEAGAGVLPQRTYPKP
ncbi:hypothetical protein T484DRAFT_1940579 [Baffinella frigidus]|nr:hypothetical protein T484DRAFT_1940579 [Cryptophyta sp. CCMP2293]